MWQLPPEDIKTFVESLENYSRFLQSYNKEGNIEIGKECNRTNFLIDYLNKNKESYFIELNNDSLSFVKATLLVLLEKLTSERDKMILDGDPRQAIESLDGKILNAKKIINEYKCFKDLSPKNLITRINNKNEEYKKKYSEEILKLEPEIYGIGIKLRPLFKRIKGLFIK